MPEEVLDRVQPRAVLSIEEDIHLHEFASLKDFAMVVELGIVHEKHNVLIHVGPL